MQNINFEISQDSIVYVAFDPNFITIPSDIGFVDTGEIVSVVEINRISVRYVIYSRSYVRGSVTFKISNTSTSYLPIMVYMRIDTTKTIVSSCGGQNVVLDATNGDDIFNCNDSSGEVTYDVGCKKAFPKAPKKNE